MKPETKVIVDAGTYLMKAFYLAPSEKKHHISMLMWECLRVASLMEDKTVDEFHQELLGQLEPVK